ncbi:MAG: hypothetical protein AAGG08_10285, partial [Actinomycetota bacterium]
RDGISYAVVSQDPLTFADRFARSSSAYDRLLVGALDQIAAGSTQRAGRLLAPLGIRFVVVPEFDGVVSTVDEPMAVPVGLTEALDEQLDIVNRFAIPTVEFYENAAALPAISLLTGDTAAVSESAGADALVRADLTDAEPVFVGASPSNSSTEEIEAGTVHVAVPFDRNWELTVDGTEIPARRAFGATLAFDVPEAGTATLAYAPPASRGWLVALQCASWLVVLFAAIRVNVSVGRRRQQLLADETLLSLDAPLPPPSIDPGLSGTQELDAALAEFDIDPSEPGPDAGTPDDTASEPATSEPATSEPATSEPAASDRSASDPAASDRSASDPATSDEVPT